MVKYISETRVTGVCLSVLAVAHGSWLVRVVDLREHLLQHNSIMDS